MTNFNTQISKEVGKEGNDFRIQFQTNNEEHFRAMQEVARCCVDSERFGEDIDFVDGYIKKSVIIDKIVNTPTSPNPHKGVATASAYRNGTATRQLEIIDYILCIPNAEGILESKDKKTSYWESGTEPNGSRYAYCPSCKRKQSYNNFGYPFCPLCGAEMGAKSKGVDSK